MNILGKKKKKKKQQLRKKQHKAVVNNINPQNPPMPSQICNFPLPV